MLTPFLAVMAMIGILTCAYIVSYPVTWAFERTVVPFGFWVQRKTIELNAAHRR